MEIHNKTNELSFGAITSTFGGASFSSVTPQAGLEKCEAYFSKELNAAPKKVRSPAGCGGECIKLKR